MCAAMLTIFDCDGVLVDSEIIAARVDAEHLTKAGYAVTPEEVAHRFAGLTAEQMFAIAAKEMGRPVPAEALARQRADLDMRLAEAVEAVAGAHAMLDALDGPRCICSNSSSARLRMTLTKTGLWDRFRPYVFSAREVRDGREKPAPDVFLHAAEAMEAAPQDTIVVEDSVHGVRAAKAAGMRVVGFTGASHSWPGHGEALMDAGAVTVVRRFAQLPATLDALRGWRLEVA
jgi:HAD superfamily hydrolase (TIGR01509 family)